MKNIFTLIFLCFFITGCAYKYPQKPIRAISNIENTKIYLNDEYAGTDYTTLYILNSKSSQSFVEGRKKGCENKNIQIEYEFDFGVLNLFNPKNVIRLLTWDVFIVNEKKDMYNVTPTCN